MPEDRLLRLIAAIYDAVTDDDAYAGLAELLAAETGATHAWFPLCDAQGELLGVPMHNFPVADVIGPYGAHYAKIDPWKLALDMLPAGRPWRLDGLVPVERMLRSEIYNDLIEPTTGGVVHCMGTPFVAHDSRGTLSLMRSQRAGSFDDDDEALVARLAPHLGQMLSLRTRLQGSGRRALYAEDALDTVPFGVLRCRVDGRVTFANRQARAIFDANDGLRTSPLLECALRSAQAALLTRLRAVVRGVVAESALQVERPSGAPSYRVIILPFATSQRTGDDEALVFVHDPMTQDAGLQQRAAELFGLSPAEADLAVGLAQGETVQEIADRRQVRISTVRSQLQSALAKTGAARQADLIRAVLSVGTARRL
ncbi:helix-turn-helix transcriptional regulator [Roseiterribacter gracilis]|uniref:HTH luxR-type domain-containing protein n=1 Tax=Roseiterribacter gracilis TaxID=2812848 RepID=A0A8S8X9G1_9PROT|nr:hypothetical protein TMPK1_23500 [Rhodospirillales bacterium TMPK1]